MTGRTARQALGLRFDGLTATAQWALAVSVAALWMLGRRYEGLVHDAILYTGIGLRRLDPSSLAGDFFFAHGAQDAFTLFPHLHATLISALGIGPAALAITIAGQAAFVFAAGMLVWRIVPPPARWWSLAVLAVVSGYYGGVGVFRIAEPFATARTFAEPLVVGCVAFALAGRPMWAYVTLALAALLHPLVAIAGLGAVLLWHALGEAVLRRRLPVAVLAVCAGFVAFLLLSESRFDAAWERPVRERSPHLFLALWHWPDWTRLGWGLCVAIVAGRLANESLRRMLAACAIVVVGGVAATGIAVDLLGNAFVAGLQLWRAHWLLHLFCLVLVPATAATLWSRGTTARAAAICLVASLCFGRFGQPAAFALSLASAAFVALDARGWMIGRNALRAVALAACSAAAVGLLFDVQTRLPLEYAANPSAGWRSYLPVAGTSGALIPIGGLLFLLAHSRRTAFALVAATSVLVASVAWWDARTPWRRFLEEGRSEAASFVDRIPPGAQVLWAAPGVPAWMLLDRPSWFSIDQGAGIVFHRATAIEYAAREEATTRLRGAIANCAAAGGQPCAIDRSVLGELCVLPNAPRFVVVNGRVPGVSVAAWRVPAESGESVLALHLNACAAFAAGERK